MGLCVCCGQCRSHHVQLYYFLLLVVMVLVVANEEELSYHYIASHLLVYITLRHLYICLFIFVSSSSSVSALEGCGEVDFPFFHQRPLPRQLRHRPPLHALASGEERARDTDRRL
eukprot:GHVU01100743.1.p1 GENE.GHVU01100743.1~~GHVU01100743.1.p1  ORF type:complete len:115 (+),score=3.13 GHVU01100743.1:397-741(+)